MDFGSSHRERRAIYGRVWVELPTEKDVKNPATENKEPIEAIEPMDPIDAMEPTDPIENELPIEPMENELPIEPMLQNDPIEPMQRALPSEARERHDPLLAPSASSWVRTTDGSSTEAPRPENFRRRARPKKPTTRSTATATAAVNARDDVRSLTIPAYEVAATRML